MFTGLIQTLGQAKAISDYRLAISIPETNWSTMFADLDIGDSVAVDGVCLTVEEFLSDGFVATTSPETQERTTLRQLTQGQTTVNLETSLRVGSKLGGHFVTGHIDGVGYLLKSISTATAWEMLFTAPDSLLDQWQQHIAPYIVSKGSIAVNGISLTVADCDSIGSWFKVSVIPHTYAQTNLSLLEVGNWVNIETDILGKYVQKFLTYSREKETDNLYSTLNQKSPLEYSNLSIAFLTENGYL